MELKMFRSAAVAELKIGERLYSFVCPFDSPLGEIHDALMQIKSVVVEKIVASQKAEQEARAKVEQQAETVEPEKG